MLRDNRCYKEEDKPKSVKISEIKCSVCGSSASYVERKGKGFITHFSQCSNCNKNIQLDKDIYDFFQVGDRIRYYNTLTFGEDAKIDFDTYVEGTIINKEQFIISYLLDMKIEKCIRGNKEFGPEYAGINCDGIYRGIDSTSNLIELLTLQMKLAI